MSGLTVRRTKKGIFFTGPASTFSAILEKPIVCACGRMTVFVVNRDGKTRCLDCDVKYQDSLRGEDEPPCKTTK